MNQTDRDLIGKLRENSLKLTGQRQKILNLLIENKEKHLNAEEIHRQLQEKGEKVGIATIYRTIGLLEKLNIIARLYLDDGSIRYQVNDPNQLHEHHHLICNRCGHIVDMEDDLMDSLEREIKKLYGFKVLNHKVKFYGICKTCLKKE